MGLPDFKKKVNDRAYIKFTERITINFSPLIRDDKISSPWKLQQLAFIAVFVDY